MVETKDSTLRMLVAFSAAQSYSVSSSNPVDFVLPLFQPIAADRNGRQFVAAELAQDVAQRYDLLVSEDLCNYWTRHLIKAGLLIPADPSMSEGAFVWRQDTLPNAPPGNFAPELTNILVAFRSFLDRRSDLFNQVYSEDELALILRRGAVGSLFPKLYEVDGYRSDEQYIFSRFVTDLVSERPNLADAIVRLRRAAIFCDLIFHLREPKVPPKNAQPITAYFDSPLVMDLIGLSGPARQSFAKQLVRGFAALKLSPMINPDMIFEIRNNLRGLINKEPSRRFGPTADALRRGELKMTIVEASLERIEPLIQEAGIVIDRSFPSHASKSMLSDELETALLSKLQSHYTFFEAASRDAKTVRGVLGRRGGNRPTDLYSAKAIFVTGNDMLAAISNRFFRENIGYSDTNFPVVVSRATAAALTDAVVGVQTTGTMTTADLLISAADITQYDPDVVDRIEARLREIAPDEADDLSQLLSQSDYSQFAMDAMRGNPRNVTLQSVTDLVSEIHQRLDQQANQRVAAERRKERTAAASRSDELAKRIAGGEAALDVALSQLREQHNRVLELARTWMAGSSRQDSVLQRALRCLAAIVGLVVAGATYLSIYSAEWLSGKTALLVIVSVIVGTAAGFPIVGLPSIRDYLLGWFRRRTLANLLGRVATMGYDLPPHSVTGPGDLIPALDQIYDARVTEIEVQRVRASQRLV